MVVVRDFQKEQNEALERQNKRLQAENEKMRQALEGLWRYAAQSILGRWRHVVADTCRNALNRK